MNFFLGQSAKLHKTLEHPPPPTPSAEAPEGGVGWFAIAMPLYRQRLHHGDGVCWMVDKAANHPTQPFLRG